MHLGCSIDWLSITAPHATQDVIPKSAFSGRIERGGMMGYKTAYQYDSGILHLWSDDREESHIIYNGKTLRKLDVSHERIGLLRWHSEQGHKVARIDTAIDLFDSNATVKEFADLWAKNRVVTRVKQGTLISDPKEVSGDTFYLGSRKRKRKLLRIYDKAKEQRVDADWLRFEVQYNGGTARSAGAILNKSDDFRTSVLAMTKQFADFNHTIYKQMMNGIIPVKAGHQRPYGEEDRMRWLIGSVMPAMVKQEIETPGFAAWFASEVEKTVTAKMVDLKTI